MDANTSVSACNSTKINTKKALNNDMNPAKIVNTDNDAIDKKFEKVKLGLFDFKTDLIWYIVLQAIGLHIIGIYGLLTFDYMKNPMTILWSKCTRLRNFSV